MKGDTQICHYCEELTENPTIDHIFPKSKIRKCIENDRPLPEGFDPSKNKVWACDACNMNKGNKEYNSFKMLGVKQIRHLKRMFINKRFSKR